MSAFGGIHVLASLWLLSKAASLAYQQPKGHEARRVAVAAFIAMLSSMLCYANFVLGFVNWYVALGLDSLVNDVCLLQFGLDALGELPEQFLGDVGHRTATELGDLAGDLEVRGDGDGRAAVGLDH